MGLVDEDYKFAYVEVGCNEKVIDGCVFKNSSFSRAFIDLITF